MKKDVWPFQIQLSIPNVETMKEVTAPDDWCKKNIGLRFMDWYSYNLTNYTRLYAFSDEASLLVFKLTWSDYGIRKND